MAEIKKYFDATALSALVAQIKAEDAKVKEYVDKHIEDAGKTYDVAGSAATAESNAKAYTDELANGQVKTNKEAIATLNGDANTVGSVAKQIAEAKALIDADVEAVDAKAVKNAEDIAAINHAETGILKQSKDYTDSEVAKVQSEVDALETYVGTIPDGATATNVIAYVQEKTSGIATEGAMTELGNRVTTVEGDVATIKGDYLKGTDKTELNGLIETAQATADGAQSYAEGVAGDLAEAVEALEGADADQIERIAALEGTIVGLSGAMHFEGVIETDPTTITEGYEQGDVVIHGNKEYVWNNGAFVEFGDASVNAEAITALTGRVTTAEGKISTLENEMDVVEGAVATKVEQSVYDQKIAELAGVDTALGNRITTLEGKFGGADGSVEDMIADAKAEAIEAAATDAASKDSALEVTLKKYADDEDAKIETRVDALEADTHTHANKALLDTYTQTDANLADAVTKKHEHANATELAKIADGDVAKWNVAEQNAKTYADGLDADMGARVDGVVSRVGALETASATHALASDLEAAVARIAKNETDIVANTSAINSFVAITSDEVNALFA